MKEEERIIYSDGHNVVVTTKEFIVDSARYLLQSIAEVRLHFVRHYKVPPLVLLFISLSGIIAGLIGAFQNLQIEELYIGDLLITSNRLAILIGIALALLSSWWLYVLHNEYVVVITTNEGNSNPISSKKRKYIFGIFEALKNAISVQQKSSVLVEKSSQTGE